MSKEDQIVEWIKEGCTRFSDDLVGYKVILFGSRARGRAKERSDFDIGVIGDHEMPLQAYYRIADFLEQLPTLYGIDWVDLNRASDALRKNALREGVVLYG